MEVTIEVSSVNRRNLETQVSTPKEWIGLDRMMSELIRKAACRGKVYLQVKVSDFSMENGFQLKPEVLESGLKRLQKASEALGIPYEPDTRLLLEMISMLKQSSELPDWVGMQDLLEKTALDAISQWGTMRELEGDALKVDATQRLKTLEGIVQSINAASGDTVREYRERLMERLRSAGLELDPEDERVLKEIALFADRCDISEEITRLNSHFSQLREVFETTGAIGRKIDFILQEVYREFNTIGSKSNNMEISRLVIEGKNLWEQLREQAANIE